MAGDRTPDEAWANVSPMLSYLDPGTGSMIMAAFAAGFSGFVVLIVMYWHRFLGIFSKKHRAQAEAAQAKLVGEANADAEVDADADVKA
jgi:hypothetical protein